MRWLTRRTGLPAAGLWLLAGTFVTTVGNAMHTFAVGKLLYDRTGSVAAFGSVIILEQASAFLMQFVAGPWVDRGDPRRTSVQVELIRGLFICFASAMLGTGLLTWIMLMTLVIRVAHPFYRAAMFSLAPAAVPSEALARFNGYSNVGLQAGQILGTILAAPVFASLGPSTAFLLNGLTFLFSAAAVALAKTPRREPAPASGPAWKQLLSSWHEIALLLRGEAGLAWHLVLSTAAVVVVQLYNLVEVPIVAERYGGSAYWLSVVGCCFAVGAIVSVAAIDPLTKRWGSRAAILISIGGQALAFALLGLSRDPWLTLALVFAIGACNTISLTVLTTTLQLRVRGPVKGRIGTTRNLLAAVVTAALVPLVSATSETSLAWALVVSGGVCLAYTLITLVLGSVRALGAGLLGEPRADRPAPAAADGLLPTQENTP